VYGAKVTRLILGDLPSCWKASRGRIAEAIRHFAAAVRIKPDYAEARKNLQTALPMHR